MKPVLVLSTLLRFSSSFPETIISRIIDFILKYSDYKLFNGTVLAVDEKTSFSRMVMVLPK